MTRWRLALLVMAVTAAQLIVGLALILVHLESDWRLMLLHLLAMLILLLVVVAALLVAEWRGAAVGSGSMRRHVFALVLVVLALSVGVVASGLVDTWNARYADGPRSVITAR
jgi:hypothetical protein